MHATELLHDLFDNACHSIDTRLRRTLFEAAETLTRCKQLSICALGRSLNRKAKVKHTIKCVDRLFGNKSLHQKSGLIYQAMANVLLKNNLRPIIIVDWSGLTPCGAFYFLRASIAAKGRSITLLDQAYPLKKYSKESTHREFLNTLKTLLPKECKPIIVTDAGFRNSWFKLVLRAGWDFIGRVRNITQYSESGKKPWIPIKSLYKLATRKPRYVGNVTLSRSTPLNCSFYLTKNKKKNRIKRNLAGKKVQCSVSKKHELNAREPWLIASSLVKDEISPRRIIDIYAKRMQIEEEFRDLKNTRHGLGLRHCRSFTVHRLNVALLVAALAMIILWVYGTAALNQNMHYSFQANTIKKRRVLSRVMIGWQVLIRGGNPFRRRDLLCALKGIILDTASGEVYGR